jgi:hypothetical protein
MKILKKMMLASAILFLMSDPAFSGPRNQVDPFVDALEPQGLSLTVFNQWSHPSNLLYEDEGLIRVLDENGLIMEEQLLVGGRMDLLFSEAMTPRYLLVEVYVFDREHGFISRYGRSTFFYSGAPRMKPVRVRTMPF